MRNFLWSGGPTKQKRSQLSWEKVTLPTKEGGLGIRRIQDQNEASFIKLGWIAMSSSSLLSNWMASKYFPNSSIWNPFSTQSGSCIWHKTRKFAHYVHSRSMWIVGDGTSVDKWLDSWSQEGSLAFVFSSYPFPPNQKLYNLWNGATWAIPADIPEAVASALGNVVQNLSLDILSQDRFVRNSHPDRNLSFKEAWQLIRARRQFAQWLNWAPLVWNSLQLSLVSFFAWRLLHGKTPTQAWVQSAGLYLASRCCLCKVDLESTPHLLFLCSFASGIWHWVLNSAGAAVVGFSL